MSEFTPISTLKGIAQLDVQDTTHGYWHGMRNTPAPGSNRSKSFWHGWRNGRVDGGHAEMDDAQLDLVAQYQSLLVRTLQ